MLTVTQQLRELGVVGKFVEFYGAGVSNMSLADRATIANMSPEYGATMGYFPVDAETLEYLRRTGRTQQEVELVERYTKEQGTFLTDGAPIPTYTQNVSLDLGTIEPSLAGPKRPQDRVPLSEMKAKFSESLRAPIEKRGFALGPDDLTRKGVVQNGKPVEITHGAVVIAAITSCTNTSNPSVMLAAGLLAKNAAERGLKVPHYVKTSLAPGSRVVTDYLEKAGLTESLEALGFPYRRIRMYDVHWQQRTITGSRCRGGQGRRAGCIRGAERQPQFRRPRQPAGAGELPGESSLGGGVCLGGHHGH